MAEKIPGWLERVLLPQISELKGEVKVIHSDVNSVGQRLDQRIDSLDEKLSQRIDHLDQKITQGIVGVERRIDVVDKRVDELRTEMEVTQRLAAVEAKVKELESRR